MRKLIVILAWATLVLSGASMAAPEAVSGDKEAEQTLKDLRSANSEELMETLRSLPEMKGYPDSAQGLLPVLLWIKNRQEDKDVAFEAEAQARALGWPEKHCLPCIRKFAGKQDKIYKMMGLTALTQIAWKDPEAMTILFEITKDGRRDMGDMIRAISSDLKNRDCGMQSDMDAWNLKALPLMGRMQSVLASANWQLRPLALILLKCDMLRDDLKRSLQSYLDRVPEPLSRLTPTPETSHY